MKIISKYKDYYDFLTGLYGIDNKLILDRRSFTGMGYLDEGILRILVGDYIVEGLYFTDKFYYGSTIHQFTTGHSPVHLSRHYNRDYNKSIEIKF